MSILQKLYIWTSENAVNEILKTYKEQWFCIVSFLYFANLMRRRLLENPTKHKQQQYLIALQDADYILPDGIALQRFYRAYSWWKSFLNNLNGTDFTPQLLNRLDPKETEIILYGGTKKVVERTTNHYKNNGRKIVHAQDGYDDLERSSFKDQLVDDNKTRLLLVARWTPRQEIRWEHHRDKIIKHKLLVLNVGWLFDFVSWEEKRAPQRMVDARVLETPRRVLTNPKKNLKKFVWMFGIVRYLLKAVLGKKVV